MPEHLAPGVYVEETSFRSKSIEGASTNTTGFIGPARYGPLDLEPEIITSLGEFERTYGDGQKLNFSDAAGMDNYLWHAVRAFFEEGGTRCYISRVFRAGDDDGHASATLPSGGGTNAVTIRARFPGEAGNMRLRFDLLVGQKSGSPSHELQLSQLDPDDGNVIRTVTVSPDSLNAKFARMPNNLAQARTLPIVIELGAGVTTNVDILTALFGSDAVNFTDRDEPTFVEVTLTGGNDGARPTAAEYQGTEEPKTGLKILEDIEDISIVAAPGSTFGYENADRGDANTIINLLISHAQRTRYRIAVVDSGDGQSISQVRALRARFDSTYAALYYPWVRVLDPVTRKEIHLPPSGFVAGIYARNDVNRAVYKAPANEVVNLALGFEKLINKAQQDVLNSEGINCFRFFEGRGFRLWGARTISSDPEWKYVNLRRYSAYLEHSIDKGTQWAVFEPNGEQLWGDVRRAIEDFLFAEWQKGGLLGDKPEKAYFVKCDRSTITQNDLDSGRLVCLVGVAPLRPAEFVIFRIGQWTADHKDP